MKDSKKTETSTMRAGFTLVELVVVIAILGILAGVAYPAYTGYIKRAQDAKVISQLSEVVVSVESARAVAGITSDVTDITVNLSSGKLTVNPKDDANHAAFAEALIQLGGGTSTGNDGYFLADATDGVKLNTAKFKLDGTSYATGGTIGPDITWTASKEKWEKTVVDGGT